MSTPQSPNLAVVYTNNVINTWADAAVDAQKGVWRLAQTPEQMLPAAVTARVGLEAAALVWWATDPDVTAAVRVGRVLAYSIESAYHHHESLDWADAGSPRVGAHRAESRRLHVACQAATLLGIAISDELGHPFQLGVSTAPRRVVGEHRAATWRMVQKMVTEITGAEPITYSQLSQYTHLNPRVLAEGIDRVTPDMLRRTLVTCVAGARTRAQNAGALAAPPYSRPIAADGTGIGLG